MVSATSPRTSASVDFAIEPLFTLPSGCCPDAMTPGGHGFTLIGLDDGRLQLFWDGEGGKPFDKMCYRRDKTPYIVASDDGEHIAYAGARAGRGFVGRDGREDAPFHALTRSVPAVFSHAGAHLAYGAAMDQTSASVPLGEPEYRLILDGEPVNTMPVAPIQAVFSPSGEHFAFVEMRAAADGGADLRIVRDGSAGPWFRGLRNAEGAMQFSPDGEHFAYCRIDEQGHSQWVLDDHAGPLTNEVRSASLMQMIRHVGVVEQPLLASFSPDGQRFAYAADVEGKGVAVVEDDMEGPRFKGVGKPAFSPDSHHLVYVAETASKKLCLVVDGVAGPEWVASSVGVPVFSPDSCHVAVTYSREDGWFMRKRRKVGCIVDGHVLAEVAGDRYCLEPVFSPDGESVAWWYEQEKMLGMMVDGAPFADDHIAYSAARFTPADHLVYAAIIVPGGRVTVMVDGRLGPLADVLLQSTSAAATFELARTDKPIDPFAVSPDGEHVAWAGVFGEEARPVIDDTMGPTFDFVLDSRFDASGTGIWWAQRDDTVYRVTGAIAGTATPVEVAQ